MTKIYFILILSIGYSTFGLSQLRLGAGATYLIEDSQFGVHGRAYINDVTEDFDLIPQFSYFIEDGATKIAIEANVAYELVLISDSVPIYGFGGLLWSRWASGDLTNTDLGINLGIGSVISEKVYVEPKYFLGFCKGCSSFGINVGYYFK